MRNKEYSMLIKYKTEPTIIVLSPNSANLIKILTQFVYSINIRYFSPPPLPCPVTLQGITNSMGERLLFNPLPLCFINPSVLRSPPLYFAVQNTP